MLRDGLHEPSPVCGSANSMGRRKRSVLRRLWAGVRYRDCGPDPWWRVWWLNGKYGLACDNVLAVDVVTAEGRHVTASSEENADLFWGIRGAGANFGVVTSFRYQL